MDRLTPARRSWLMSRVRGRDTKPEMEIRRRLHALGYRFRLHASTLPGKPDLTFPSKRKIILVHGCYWHGHSCRYGLAQSKSRRCFWREKLLNNQRRDRRVRRKLRSLGWRVLIVWECDVKNKKWEPKAVRFLERKQ
jgi:DNA mismatch endonuclease, patch repair protein